MSQFQDLIRSRDSPLNIQTLIKLFLLMPFCWCRSWQMVRWKMYLVQKDMKNFSVFNVCCIFKNSYIFWMILILLLGDTSLFFETVTMKFMGPRTDKKQIPNYIWCTLGVKIIHVLNKFMILILESTEREKLIWRKYAPPQMFDRVLSIPAKVMNMPLFLNMPGFWMY